MTSRLARKVAVVTGAGRGIGRGIALAFASEGAIVVLVDVDENAVSSLAGEISAAGGTAWASVANVTEPTAVVEMVRKSIARFGAIHVLVNNAGIGGAAPLVDLPFEQWQRTLSADLTSVFLCCKAALPGMISQRWGRIINIGSQLAISGSAEMAHYCAAKAGVHGFTRALAREVAAYNITANVIAPGPIETRLLDSLPPSWRERKMADIPLGRFGTVDDVAPTAVLLASDGGSYYTGSTLNVSGGDVMA